MADDPHWPHPGDHAWRSAEAAAVHLPVIRDVLPPEMVAEVEPWGDDDSRYYLITIFTLKDGGKKWRTLAICCVHQRDALLAMYDQISYTRE